MEGPVWNFSTYVPVACGNVLTDTRDVKTYNAVQIETQCWMTENRNIGIRVDASGDQTNNTTIENIATKTMRPIVIFTVDYTSGMK